MSRTGGGRGTNQYGVRGVGKASPAAVPKVLASAPEVALSTTSGTSAQGYDWEQLLADYPTYPGDVQATPEPDWDDLASTVEDIQPKGRARAIARYKMGESKALYTDAHFEGFAFTEPEVSTLLDGGYVGGRSEGELAQFVGIKRASDLMLVRLAEGETFEPGLGLSNDLHMNIGVTLGLPSHTFRGDQSNRYEGPRVGLGRDRIFRALDSRMTPYVVEAGLERIATLDHPMLRAATWAALATYHQIYFDGNKRAGRYTMNAVLMSHGFDAILIPETKRAEYLDAVVAAYEAGDLTPHIEFLLQQYRD